MGDADRPLDSSILRIGDTAAIGRHEGASAFGPP